MLLGACAQPQQPQVCAAPLKPAVEVDLYYGAVSATEWISYLEKDVTPLFPEGLTAIDASGQWRDPSGKITHEKSKLLILIVFDAPAHLPKVKQIVDIYLARFHQQAVLRTEHAVCAG